MSTKIYNKMWNMQCMKYYFLEPYLYIYIYIYVVALLGARNKDTRKELN